MLYNALNTMKAKMLSAGKFSDGHYNHQRYHESLKPHTAWRLFGRGQTILFKRERIKLKTFELRRLQHRKAAA